MMARLKKGFAMNGDRRTLVGLVLLLLILAFAAVYAYWAFSKPKGGYFGSLAISATSQDYGISWGYADALGTYKRSLEECSSRPTAKDCTVRMSLVHNCGALVMSQERNMNFAVTDSDKTQASAFAMAQCQAAGAGDCVLKEAFCGTGP